MLKLIHQKLSSPVLTVSPTNHIVVVDCSGSMYSDIDKIRQHLKNKIPSMVKPDDSLTLIWFSGKDEYGVLFEGAKVNGLKDLSHINGLIDRYLTTVGLTGFKQPLEEVLAVINRMTDMQHSMIFMTDGHDNIWKQSEIIQACTQLSDQLVSSCFVEYGYYADHDLLLEMAEETGGSLVQANEFSKFAFHLDSIQTMSFGKRITIDAPDTSPEYSLIVGHTADGYVLAKNNTGKVSFPSNTLSYSYITGSGDTFEMVSDAMTACAVVAALIQRGNADIAMNLAAKIGDVTLYKTIENAFSKQDYIKVTESAEQIYAGKIPLYAHEPRSTNLVQDPDAYNVLQLLLDLSSSEGNSIVLNHPDFVYNAIGQKRTAIEVNGHTPVFTDSDAVSGNPILAKISSLSFDSDRPNASILVKRHGNVSLPANDYGFGDHFETYIWRNYTMIRDGIVNVEILPVILNRKTFDILESKGLVSDFKVGKTFLLNLKKLPVINRSMVKGVTADWMFKTCYQEYCLEAKQKYVKTKIDKPEVGEKFSGMYGEEAAAFLKSYGISEGGFSPLTEAESNHDKYTAKVLSVKLAGMSSLPKIDDVLAAINKGKTLTPGQSTMQSAIEQVDAMLQTKSPEDILDQIKDELKTIRSSIVKAKFGVILGRKWFTDLNGFDDTTRQMDFGLGKPIKCEVVLSDKLV